MTSYQEQLKLTKYRVRDHGPLSIEAGLEGLLAASHGHEPDVYGTGSLLTTFEKQIADDLGMPQGVFFPSGTMAQQIMMRIMCEEKKLFKVAYHPLCHMEIHEQEGLKVLHHIESHLLGEKNRLFTLTDLAQIEAVSAVVFELPQRELGGVLPSWDDLVEMTSYCKTRGFYVHLDGARLFEVLPYYQKSAQEVCALFDTVYISFYKGLGAITGAMLLGPPTWMDEAKIWKRRHGGDLFHLYPYILSAKSAYALRKDKMAAYWESAKVFAKRLNQIQGIHTKPLVPVCNMFHVVFDQSDTVVMQVLTEVMKETHVALFGGIKPLSDKQATTECTLGDRWPTIPEGVLENALSCFSTKWVDSL